MPDRRSSVLASSVLLRTSVSAPATEPSSARSEDMGRTESGGGPVWEGPIRNSAANTKTETKPMAAEQSRATTFMDESLSFSKCVARLQMRSSLCLPQRRRALTARTRGSPSPLSAARADSETSDAKREACLTRTFRNGVKMFASQTEVDCN